MVVRSASLRCCSVLSVHGKQYWFKCLKSCVKMVHTISTDGANWPNDPTYARYDQHTLERWMVRDS